MGVMGVSLISPVLPELRQVFGVSDAQIGLVVTAYTLPGVFITPFVGIVADRAGRKRVLVPLLALFGLGGAGIAFTTDFAVLLGLRFLQGIGASALVTLAITLIGDRYEGSQRDTLIGLNGSMIGTGAAFYPILGGGLAVLRWNAPFLFFGVGLLASLFAVVVMTEPSIDRAASVGSHLSGMYAVARLPSALALFLAVFSSFFVFYGAVITALPLLLSDEFGLTAGEIGPIIGMVALANAVVSSQYGRIAEVRTAPELTALGFGAFGVSLVLVWLAPTVVLVAPALVAFGIGFGVVMPSIDTTAVSLVSEDRRAGMMGMRTSLLRLGQTLGPIWFTFAAEAFFETTVVGYRLLLLLTGVVVLAGGGLAYVGLRA
jgi:MFS family permease